MSVLIKGMTMPDMCSECDFLSGLICPDGIYVCECPVESIHGRNVSKAIDGNVMHPDCPLREVPEPHGRLIDADALLKDAPRYVDLPPRYEPVFIKVPDVMKTPTVIEAEGK